MERASLVLLGQCSRDGLADQLREIRHSLGEFLGALDRGDFLGKERVQ